MHSHPIVSFEATTKVETISLDETIRRWVKEENDAKSALFVGQFLVGLAFAVFALGTISMFRIASEELETRLKVEIMVGAAFVALLTGFLVMAAGYALILSARRTRRELNNDLPFDEDDDDED